MTNCLIPIIITILGVPNAPHYEVCLSSEHVQQNFYHDCIKSHYILIPIPKDDKEEVPIFISVDPICKSA